VTDCCEERREVGAGLGQSLLAAAPNTENQDPPPSLRRTKQRGVIHPVVNSVTQAFRGTLEPLQDIGKRHSVTMPDKVRNVLDQEKPRPKDGNVFGHRRQNTIVAIATVMVTVPQPAETLTWWSRGDKLDVANTSAVSLYELTSFLS
jgi:hypothetical protein